jgi:hypothetical protein
MKFRNEGRPLPVSLFEGPNNENGDRENSDGVYKKDEKKEHRERSTDIISRNDEYSMSLRLVKAVQLMKEFDAEKGNIDEFFGNLKQL